MIIGNKQFNLGHTYIMGILNVTPDSFSDGGKFNNIDSALKHVEDMISEGADVIDVGGESTRPGYIRISEQEEIERISPVIDAVNKNFDIPISIDTYKPVVAKEAVRVGACLINDIWGLKGENLSSPDSGMAKIIADTRVSCCIMHNKNLDMPSNTDNTAMFKYNGVADSDFKSSVHDEIINVVTEDLKSSINLALKAGISKDKIMLDAGIGFGKTYEDNLNCIKHLDDICKAFEYPMLLGTSRKSVIGLTLGLDKSERMEGTLATTAKAVENGCLFVRVHDVKENARFIRMYEALRK